MERRRGGATGRGDHVAQSAGCIPDCLVSSVDPSSVSITRSWATWRGKPEMDGGVDKRFHDEEDVRRAGAGYGGGHGHELLVVDFDLGAEAAQAAPPPAPAGPRSSPGSRTRPSSPSRDGPAYWASSAPTWSWPRIPTRAFGRRTGQHRQDELPALQVRPDLAADAVEHLGLDAQQDHVRAFDRLDVRLHGPDVVLPGELLPTLRSRMAGDDLPGFDELAAQDPGNHGLRHDARTDGRGDRAPLQGGHRAEYRPRHLFHGRRCATCTNGALPRRRGPPRSTHDAMLTTPNRLRARSMHAFRQTALIDGRDGLGSPQRVHAAHSGLQGASRSGCGPSDAEETAGR